MGPPQFDEMLTQLRRASDMAGLSTLLAALRDETGVAHLVYHLLHAPGGAGPNPVLLFTCDDAWAKRYIGQDHLQADPVVAAGRQSFLPFDWMTIDHASPTARQFFAAAESHGVGRHCFTLPIRGPYGERALFTFTSNETDHHWHRWRHVHLRDFHLVAHYLHDRVMQLAGLRPGPAIRPLSRREQQCLQLLAEGRTPQQVADGLDLSASAVHLYLRSARHKLKCTTIEQAIGKAVRLELIPGGAFADR
ncbi:LuxR family transcriptional regulator [Bradyrhizobium sp. WD16]|nr:LuxR family transcriptional regulator [Bradyrhizobium sp. WD16]